MVIIHNKNRLSKAIYYVCKWLAVTSLIIILFDVIDS